MQKSKGKDDHKASFILKIRFAKNSSWQGTLVWKDNQESINFRSELELLQLIDSVQKAK